MSCLSRNEKAAVCVPVINRKENRTDEIKATAAVVFELTHCLLYYRGDRLYPVLIWFRVVRLLDVSRFRFES